MWKNIQINKQNIKAETMKAVLIQMPHNSNYDGFSFWHPSKLVRTGYNSNALSIGYNDDFTFNLIKYGKGKYILAEEVIGVEEFEEAFRVMNENITASHTKNIYETHKPAPLEVKEVSVLDELKDE